MKIAYKIDYLELSSDIRQKVDKSVSARNREYKTYFDDGYVWLTNVLSEDAENSIRDQKIQGREAISIEPAFDVDGNTIKGLKAILVKGLPKDEPHPHLEMPSAYHDIS